MVYALLYSFWDYAGTVGLVLLGAVVSLVATVVVEERKHRRDSARDEAQRRRRLRSAARLVRDEIIHAEVEIEMALSERRWWPSETELATREWDEHRGTLADGIDDTTNWYGVTAAYTQIRELNRRRAELPRGQPTIGTTVRETQSESDEVLLRTAEQELRAAQGDLGDVAEQAPGRTPPEP